MSHEKDGDDASVNSWLREQHPLPRLEDSSTLAERKAFLKTYGDVLWSFWSKAFSIAFSSGRIDPKRALGAHAHEWDQAARELTDHLLEALGTRPTMGSVPSWENLERWNAWLIGSAAARTHKFAPARASSENARGDDVQAELLDLRRLVERWTKVLESLVERTGVHAIELDWLWATRRVRQRLPSALGELEDTARILDTHLPTSIASSSAPGASTGARVARTRDGAAACFRFNLEELATRRAPSHPLLIKAREVFIGPTQLTPPYRPRVTLSEQAVDGFREALCLSATEARALPDDSAVERLWKDVFRCALKDAVLRLLPRKLGDALQTESSLWMDASASSEKDAP